MMKTTRFVQTFAVLVLFLLLLGNSKIVFATPDGWSYGQHTIYVNDQKFEVWGYTAWDVIRDVVHNYRLRDIAYILDGTSAQFNIRNPLNHYLHFWIERNVPYEPIGTELNYLYEERRDWRGIGQFHAYAVEHFPLQQVILSLDGSEAPTYNIIVTVLTSFGFPLNEPERLADLNQVYFDLENLAGILGFNLELDEYNNLHITTGVEHLTSVIETKPLESLDASLRLTGHWVDRRFFDSAIINQEVAWPHEFEIGLLGLTYHPRFVDFMFTGLPLSARQPNIWHIERIFFPFSVQFYEDGIIMFSADEVGRKLRADLSSMPVNVLIYYIDGVPNEMVRLNPNLTPGRYNYATIEDGGIHIAYIADYQSFMAVPEYINIYRSNIQGYLGERILTHVVVDKDDHIFFEFVDSYATSGRAYFYTINTQGWWRNYHTITFGGESQIAVQLGLTSNDVVMTEVDMFEPEETESSEQTEYEINTPPYSTDNIAMILIVISAVTVALGVFFVRLKSIKTRQLTKKKQNAK